MARKLVRSSRRPQLAQVPFGPWTKGTNERAEPHLLEYSELEDGLNLLLDESTGKTKKRPGAVYRGIAYDAANAAELTSFPTRTYNFTKLDGEEILLVTDNYKILETKDLVNWYDITPAAFLTAGLFTGGQYFIDFATAEDKCWFTNGVDPVCSWDGSADTAASVVVYDKTSAEITYSGAGGALTTLVSASFDRAADGTTWVGQLLVCTSATNTGNIGITRAVTQFVDGTNTITFAAFPFNITDGDKFILGVNIPKGRYVKHFDGNLFVASTPENQAEVRFTAATDPNDTEVELTFSNPNAWPSTHQLDVGGDSGDRVWGFTNPVYRDRVAVFKAKGIYRIDPDPTYIYKLSTISEQFGSRFPLSCQQQGDVLVFLGQDADGKPDVFTTDLVTVSHSNRKHHVTLDGLKQPNYLSKAHYINSEASWNEGTKSSAFTDTTTNSLIISKMDTSAEYVANLSAGNNIDMQTNEGKIGVLGAPSWGVSYVCGEFDLEPDASDPVWAKTTGGNGTGGSTVSVVAGELIVDSWLEGLGGSSPYDSYTYYTRTLDTGVTTKDVFAVVRLRHTLYGNADSGVAAIYDNANAAYAYVDIENGAYKFFLAVTRTKVFLNGSEISTGNNFDNGNYYIFHCLLMSSGSCKVWMNGSLIGTVAGTATAAKQIYFGNIIYKNGSLLRKDDIITDFMFMKYHEDFYGNKLNSQSGKISPVTMPSTLPLTGDVTFIQDYKKNISANPTYYSLGKYHYSVDVGASSLTHYSQSSNDDVTYSSLVSFNSGDEIGVANATPKRRYLKVKTSFAIAGGEESATGAFIQGIVGGILYLTEPIYVTSDIKTWDILQFDTSDVPSTLEIKVRIATTASLAAAGVSTPNAISEVGWDATLGNADLEGWCTISANGNIGTALGGNEETPHPPYPDARYLQVKIQACHANYAETSAIGYVIPTWAIGSPENLPTNAVVWKKIWLCCCAQLDSTYNDIIVTVDNNKSFMNWSGFQANSLFWFYGRLYAIKGSSKEILELSDSVLNDDNGSGVGGRTTKAINAYLVTKQEHGGVIYQRKKARVLDVISDGVNYTATVSYKGEQDAAYTSLATLTFTTTNVHERINMPGNVQFKRITFKVANNVVNEDLAIEGLVLELEHVPSVSGE